MPADDPTDLPADDPTVVAAPDASRPRARWGRFRRSRAWRWGRWPLLALVALGVVGLTAFGYLYATVDLPDEPPQVRSSVVLDAKGRELAILQKDEMRVEVSLEEIAPIVPEALVAAEDRDFYEHDGVDPRGILRALRNNAGGGATQGGSTITQQLVKNEFLSSERSFRRKAKEAVLAIKLDRSTDKDQILERYLNTVYFGRGAYGIEAAADTYFDVHAKDLDVPQAALLIGLLRAPEAAEPMEHPDIALDRRNAVIDDLVEVGDLDRSEGEEAKQAELGAVDRPNAVTLQADVGAHVVEWIRQEAIERFGEQAVYGGGLTIRTTIDIDQQRAAEEAVASVLPDPADPEAALVALDGYGGVKAEVGGRDFTRSQVDLARGADGGGSGRQAGSAFKPIVLAAALEDGTATLGSTFRAPGELTLEADGQPWTVGNYGGSGYGIIDLQEATANSVNTAYAQLSLQVGAGRSVEVAHDLGIVSDLEPNPSIVLGAEEVSPLELASAYSTFGRDGKRIEPYVISSVEDADGSVIYEAEPDPVQAIQPEAARAVNHALRGVVEEGTGTAAKVDRPMAGKTGTTQNNGDAWFAGYTPNLTAVVWMGYPEGPQRQMSDVHGRAVTGGSFPAEIWKAFVERVAGEYEPMAFAEPPDELLRPPALADASLAITPERGPSGTVVSFTGTGFETCLAGWTVSIDPGGSSTGGSASGDAIEGSIVVPDGLGSGRARIIASCDRGRGAEAIAEATFSIDNPKREGDERGREEPGDDVAREPKGDGTGDGKDKGKGGGKRTEVTTTTTTTAPPTTTITPPTSTLVQG